MTHKLFLISGSIAMALAVCLGAFGAHGLKQKLDTYAMSVYQTGVEYHFYHALGLLLIGLLSQWMQQSTLLTVSGWTMTAGIMIFSGSLYILALSGAKWLGAITPIGGVCFIAAWVMLAIAVAKAG